MQIIDPIMGSSRKVWLAGLGAVAMAQDEIVDFTNRLVERGSITEQDSRKVIDELVAWQQKNMKMAEQSVRDAETELQRQVEALLCRAGLVTKVDLEKMNLPTKADIHALGEKVAALSRKIDELRKSEKQQTRETEIVKAA